MPGFDRSGPIEQCFRRGRSLGKCNPDRKKSNNKSDSEDNFQDSGTRFGRLRRIKRRYNNKLNRNNF